jgi:membrane fusion protein, multidrug efflux system
MNEQLPPQYIVRARRAGTHWWRSLSPKFKRWALIGAAAGAVVLLVLALRGGTEPGPQTGQRGRFGGPGGGMPSTVSLATIGTGNLGISLNALGTVTPLATVTVKPQVSGRLTEIAFTEGQMVNQGDLLAVIDPRPFQAALDQANAQLLHDQAVLQNARLDLGRFRTLLKEDSIARQQVDSQAAQVKQGEATVKSDEAQVETASLNLEYCHITAPISGRVGLRQIDTGNFVETGLSTGIVVITQIHPMSVIFTLPEDNLIAVERRLKSGEPVTVTAYDRTNTTLLATSQDVTLNNEIDTTTGTLKLRAVFSNDDGMLFPNQFVNVRVLVDELHDVVLAPNAAVQYGAPGSFVYIYGEDSTVQVRPVKVGANDETHTVITEGLKPGEKVVTDGIDRLKDGAKVIPAGAGGPGGAGAMMGFGPGRDGGPGAAGGGPGVAGGAGATGRPGGPPGQHNGQWKNGGQANGKGQWKRGPGGGQSPNRRPDAGGAAP